VITRTDPPFGAADGSNPIISQGKPIGSICAAMSSGSADASEVRADRPPGDVQLGRDLRVGAAPRDQGDQFTFPRAELG
jgi:hypothetical protein